MLLTKKIRIKNNKALALYLEEASERCRVLYNFALAEKKKHYELTKQHLGLYTHKKTLVELKNKFPEYNRIYNKCLQEVHFRLDKAYKDAFRRFKTKQGKFGFPRFKKKDEFFSQVYPGMFIRQVNEKEFILPTGKTYEKNFDVILTEDIPNGFREVTVTKQDNRYYACFTYEKKEQTSTKNKNTLYCDLGIKALVTAVTDKSEVVKVPKFSHHSKHLDSLQSKRDKCKKGSRRHKKLSRIFKKQYSKYVRRATDYLHKSSSWMAYKRTEGRIVVGKLNLNHMQKPSQAWFNRILCNAWRVGRFVQFLKYKTKIVGKVLEEVDESGTTKTCCHCGSVKEMTLSDRTYECPQCGMAIDRDVNSALNLKNRYRKNNRGATAQFRLTSDEELAKASKLTMATMFAYI